MAEALLQQYASGKRLGALLVELGAIDDLDLARALSIHLRVPLADLRRDAPEDDAIASCPRRSRARSRRSRCRSTRRAASRSRWPTRWNADAVAADPQGDRQDGHPDDRAALGHPARHRQVLQGARLASAATWRRSWRPRRSPRKDLEQTDAGDAAPVVQVVNLIITQGVRDRASDIHIEPQDARVRVRYRIDGALHDVLALPANMGPAVVSRVKVLAGMNIVERRRPQDGQIAMEVDGRPLDVRVATTTDDLGREGRAAAARQEPLALPSERTRDAGEHARALLATDPLAVRHGDLRRTDRERQDHHALRGARRDQPEREQHHDGRGPGRVRPALDQPDPDPGPVRHQFAGGLKAILRQDPDVILVGEMRDVETARIGIQSALTGHFVLTSLHATDAAGALERFLDLGIEPFLVASSVIGVVGQRLVRRICSALQVPYEPPGEELEFYQASGGPSKDEFWHGEGCNFCFHTGFEDRIGVYELLLVTAGDEAAPDAQGQPRRDPGARARAGHALRCATAVSSSWRQDVTTISRSHPEHVRDLRPRHDQVQVRSDDADGQTLARRHRGHLGPLGHGRARREGLDVRQIKEKRSVLQFEVTRKKLPQAELMHFSRQLAAFVRAGIPLVEALR